MGGWKLPKIKCRFNHVAMSVYAEDQGALFPIAWGGERSERGEPACLDRSCASAILALILWCSALIVFCMVSGREAGRSEQPSGSRGAVVISAGRARLFHGHV